MSRQSRAGWVWAAAVCCAVAVSAAPCDIYAKAGTPCVAAYSVARVMFDEYAGPLFTLHLNDSTGASVDVYPTAAGVANASTLEGFCGSSAVCVVSKVFDQSTQGNDLPCLPNNAANATAAPAMVMGQKVYGLYIEDGTGYTSNTTTGVATGDAPETMYMVVDGKHYNGNCCFDFGNAETSHTDTGRGSMEAVYFGTSAESGRGNGPGPWVLVDLEKGLWPGPNHTNPAYNSVQGDFVTAMAKGAPNKFTLRAAVSSGPLRTEYDGVLPAGYVMNKQGTIVLGVGGDLSPWGVGTFFEGVMTTGYTSDDADAAVQMDIAKANYQKL